MSPPPQPGQPPYQPAAPGWPAPQAPNPKQFNPGGYPPPPAQYPGYSAPVSQYGPPQQYAPPAPGYPPPPYGPPVPMYAPPVPYGPPPMAAYRPPRPPRTGLTAGRVLGALFTAWGCAVLLGVLLHWPITNLVGNLVGFGGRYDSFTFALGDWLIYTVPVLAAGALTLIFLRPNAGRVFVALGFAAASALIELALEPTITRAVVSAGSGSESTLDAGFALVYALSTTALCAAWLVVRGRKAARVTLALVALPLAWAAQFGFYRLTEAGSVNNLLSRWDYSVGAFLVLLAVLLPISIVGWLAAIGGSPAPAPAMGYPVGPAAVPGYPGPSAPPVPPAAPLPPAPTPFAPPAPPPTPAAPTEAPDAQLGPRE